MSKYFSFLRKKRNPSLHEEDGNPPNRGKRKGSGGKKSSSQSPKSSKSSTSSTNRHSVHSLDFYDEMKEISSGADPFYSDSDSVLDSASVGDISVETDEKDRKFERVDDCVFEKVGEVKITRVDVDEDEGHVIEDENDELIDDFMDEALDDLEEDPKRLSVEKSENSEGVFCPDDDDTSITEVETELLIEGSEAFETRDGSISKANEVAKVPKSSEANEDVVPTIPMYKEKEEVAEISAVSMFEGNEARSTSDVNELFFVMSEGEEIIDIQVIQDIKVKLSNEVSKNERDETIELRSVQEEESESSVNDTNVERAEGISTFETKNVLSDLESDVRQTPNDEMLVECVNIVIGDFVDHKIVTEKVTVDNNEIVNDSLAKFQIQKEKFEEENSVIYDCNVMSQLDSSEIEVKNDYAETKSLFDEESNVGTENDFDQIDNIIIRNNINVTVDGYLEELVIDATSVEKVENFSVDLLEEIEISHKVERLKNDILEESNIDVSFESEIISQVAADINEIEGDRSIVSEKVIDVSEDSTSNFPEDSSWANDARENLQKENILAAQCDTSSNLGKEEECVEEKESVVQCDVNKVQSNSILDKDKVLENDKETSKEVEIEDITTGVKRNHIVIETSSEGVIENIDHEGNNTSSFVNNSVASSNSRSNLSESSELLSNSVANVASSNKEIKDNLSQTHTNDLLSPYSSTLPSEVDDEEFDSAKEELSNGEEDPSTHMKNLVIENLSSEILHEENVLGSRLSEIPENHEGSRVGIVKNQDKRDHSVLKDECDLSESSQVESSLASTSSEDYLILDQSRSNELNKCLKDCGLFSNADLSESRRSYSTQTSNESVIENQSGILSDSGPKRRISNAGRRNSASELCGFTYKRRNSTSEMAGVMFPGINKNGPEQKGKQIVTEDNFLMTTVNADYLEAEARLAQRRAARAEARELRLREIEKQQKNEQQESNEEEEQYAANSHSPAECRISSSGMRTGSPYHSKGPATRTPSTPRARSSVPVNSLSRRSSEDSIPDDLLPASARDLKANLLELEEKFRKAMVTNAQLDNEKATLTYEVEFLKDKYTDLEEAHIQLTKEHKKKCSENEQLRKYSNKLKEEIKMVRRVLQERDELIQEYGLVLIGEENGEESSYDDFDDAERKDDTINDLSPRKIGVKKALLSQEASELLAKGAAKGSLDVRLKKYAEDKHDLEDEVRRLKLVLEEELSRQRKENGLDYEKQKETSKSLNECKFKIQKTEAEVSTLQANVVRLESLVTRYKTSTEELEKSEEELKAEKRRLQRELREVKERCDELETSKAYVKRQYEKLLHDRGRV